METEQSLRLGDIVEVTYVKKIVGYLYKMDENEIVLSNSPEITGENQLFTVNSDQVTEVFSYNRPQAPRIAQSEPKKTEDNPKVLRPVFGRPKPVTEPA